MNTESSMQKPLQENKPTLTCKLLMTKIETQPCNHGNNDI